MATYNGEKYIIQQIDSILEQLNENDELIISDDGSSDSTIDIISAYNDKRIKLVSHKRKSEFSKKYLASFRFVADNFQNALQYVTGDFIFFSDQDDIWLPGRIEEFVACLKKYDVVMCNFAIMDSTNNIIYDKKYESSPLSKYLLINIIHPRFLGCCMGFTKKMLEYVLPFPLGLIGHDYWIGCIGTKIKKNFFIDKPLHIYRRYDKNVSTASSKSNNTLWIKLLYRLEFSINLILRLFYLRFDQKNKPQEIIDRKV
jgi:glycosyltransferase involved in cell wall biosynthesis